MSHHQQKMDPRVIAQTLAGQQRAALIGGGQQPPVVDEMQFVDAEIREGFKGKAYPVGLPTQVQLARNMSTLAARIAELTGRLDGGVLVIEFPPGATKQGEHDVDNATLANQIAAQFVQPGQHAITFPAGAGWRVYRAAGQGPGVRVQPATPTPEAIEARVSGLERELQFTQGYAPAASEPYPLDGGVPVGE